MPAGTAMEEDEIIDISLVPKSRKWECMYLYVNKPEEKKTLDSPKVEDISVKIAKPEEIPYQNKIEVIVHFEEKKNLRSDDNIQMK